MASLFHHINHNNIRELLAYSAIKQRRYEL
nr:MAG TPA: hypothetical protein [Caudoviricetes sp.]